MKRTRLLNSELSYEISKLGHTDTIVVCDAGLPISNSIKRIDLALEKGIPEFLRTLDVMTDELFVERAIVSKEMLDVSLDLYNGMVKLLTKKNEKIIIEEVPHLNFKEKVNDAKAIVRTGESIWYANVILVAGVVF